MAQSRYPVALYSGTNVYSVTYTAGWDGPHLIDDGMLDDQWTPQRNGWGYSADGYAYWVQTETSSNDLEVWKNSAGNWIVNSGSWSVVNSTETDNYETVDVHSRKNWLWIIQQIDAVISPFSFDCKNNSITDILTGPNTVENDNYSFTLTSLLQGAIHYAFIRAEGKMGVEGTLVDSTHSNPAIISDNGHRLWVFYSSGTTIQYSIQDTDPMQEEWVDNVEVYTIVDNFNGQYNVCHRPEDDTMHMALVDYAGGPYVRSYGTEYDIIVADTAFEQFTIAGNHAAEFGIGVTFEVNGSTANDGDWTVTGVFFNLTNTVISVSGDITDGTADGKIKAYTLVASYNFSLKYLRRTPNGWTTTILDTWNLNSGSLTTAQTTRITPQITSSPTGIMIYNLEYNADTTINLNYYYLDGYAAPTVLGSWLSGTVDSGTQAWEGICAPENWPI